MPIYLKPAGNRPLRHSGSCTVSRNDGIDMHQGEGVLRPRKNLLSAGKVEKMPSVSRQAVSEKLYWRGALTQAMSLGLGGELLNALKGCDTLTVNLANVELLDYSCLAILCAVKRQANEKGRELVLEGLENPRIASLVHRYRNNGNRLCRAYCGDSCLFN